MITRHILLFLGVCAAPAFGQLKETPPKPGEVSIAWYGQSMFLIVTPKGTRVVLDPHDIEAHKVPYLTADLLLMSHLHTDHTTTTKVENAAAIKQVNAMKKTEASATTGDWNPVDEKFRDVRFQSLATYHDDASGLKRGKNGGWVLDVEPGLRVVHLGDLGHQLTPAQLKKLGKVDVLMVPAGGVYTLNGIEAFRVFEAVKPTRHVIPMHVGSVTFDDLLPAKYFLDEAKENEVPIRALKPKEWLSIDPKSPAPKAPDVAFLSYLGPGGSDVPKIKKAAPKKEG